MKHLSRIDASELVVVFAGLQARVLDALHEDHPTIRTSPHHSWPQRVRLMVDGVEWLGTRHGVGFRFQASDGRVIESHDGILNPPYPIDAYRLGEYAESIGADVIALENITFASDDTRAFERCLPVLMERGRIVADYRPKEGGLARYTLKA